MPTKILNSPLDHKGNVKSFKFGGGANEIIANADDVNAPDVGYIINSGGGNDTVTGSSNDDMITGGKGSDWIIGGLGNDTIFGGEDAAGTDAAKGKNAVLSSFLVGDEVSVGGGLPGDPVIVGGTYNAGNDIIYGSDGGNNTIYGDNAFTLTLAVGETFNGGNDYLKGGDGVDGVNVNNSLIGDTQSILADSTSSFDGGNDKLVGGSGTSVNLDFGTPIFSVSNTMTGDAGSAGGMGAGFQGGNDTLISGAFARDTMTGDWATGAAGGEVGGADTFVFGPDNGVDTITDFRSTDGAGGDTINLQATGLSAFSDLDDNIPGGDGVLDEQDAFASLNANGDLVIDLGAAVGDGTSGVNTITLNGVTSLTADDFDFITPISPEPDLIV